MMDDSLNLTSGIINIVFLFNSRVILNAKVGRVATKRSKVKGLKVRQVRHPARLIVRALWTAVNREILV